MRANTASKPIPFSEVPAGAVFKALRPEYHRDYSWSRASRAANPSRTSVLVENNGTYVKIANSHAHDVVKNADAIFDLRMPCRVLDNIKINTSHLPDWAINNAGKPN